MLYCVLFQDTPGKDHLRHEYMSNHLAFLESVGPNIKGAGPLFDTQSGQGGMWLVEAKSHEEVQKLVEQDPFWPTGLRDTIRILEWRQVFRDGRRV